MSDLNWSDLNVGNYRLNHSEGFFTVKSDTKKIKIEKLNRAQLADKENVSDNGKNVAGTSQQIKIEPSSNCRIKNEVLIKSEHLNNKLTSSVKSGNLLKTALTNVKKALHQEQNPPSAYRYKEIYDTRKKRMINEKLEEERKKREFHSRPVPNFKQKIQSEVKIPITVPVTPNVLKKSRENGVIRQRKFEEMNRQNQPHRLYAREARVLYEQPFVPKKLPHFVELQPFNLNVEKRLEERKQYDEIYNKKIEEKKKQLEEQQKIHDDNLIKEFRKLATFKARPNPFK